MLLFFNKKRRKSGVCYHEKLSSENKLEYKHNYHRRKKYHQSGMRKYRERIGKHFNDSIGRHLFYLFCQYQYVLIYRQTDYSNKIQKKQVNTRKK